jgi:hypothetical protein
LLITSGVLILAATVDALSRRPASDCIAVVEPWRTSVYVDGAAYVAGGLCCALTAGWPTREDALPGFTAIDECAHPMTRGELPG